MISEFIAARWNFGDSGPVKTSTYHSNETPPQLVIEVETLKL